MVNKEDRDPNKIKFENGKLHFYKYVGKSKYELTTESMSDLIKNPRKNVKKELKNLFNNLLEEGYNLEDMDSKKRKGILYSKLIKYPLKKFKEVGKKGKFAWLPFPVTSRIGTLNDKECLELLIGLKTAMNLDDIEKSLQGVENLYEVRHSKKGKNNVKDIQIIQYPQLRTEFDRIIFNEDKSLFGKVRKALGMKLKEGTLALPSSTSASRPKTKDELEKFRAGIGANNSNNQNNTPQNGKKKSDKEKSESEIEGH